jgi:Fic family protein
VTITGSRHTPPQIYMVKKLMEDIFLWYGEHKDHLHPVLLAADRRQKIVGVHPWIDGNGHTCRLAMNLIFLRHGFPIARIAGDDEARLAYYSALEAAQVPSNLTPFKLLVAAYVRQSLLEFLSMVSGDTAAQAQDREVFARMMEGRS